jgi:methanogenic corrinoid protein MtbC1
MGMDAVDLERLREEFLDALVWGDARLAELIGLEAISSGLDLATLYVDVMTPALYSVGERWQRGEMSIADEHLATSLVDNVMGLVRNAGTQAPRRSRERLLLAAVEAEGHVVGLRMLADLAEGAGFDVRYLGAAVPAHTLEGIVRRHDPQVVGLTMTIGAPAAAMVTAVDILAERCPGVAIVIGGSGVPEKVREDPRVNYAPDTREALALIESLVGSEPAAATG